MRLFDIFKRKYDMDSLEGIKAIPVPAKNYNTGDWTKDCIHYVLQRKATEHKKNGRMDLAIACLRKSNELADCDEHSMLTSKDYFRLVKYIEKTGDIELAKQEEEKIYARHPEFLDKHISNMRNIKETLQKCEDYKSDLVFITTNSYCKICSMYNRNVYSISGKDKRYPKLPAVIAKEGGGCPDCSLGISIFFDGISTPPET